MEQTTPSPARKNTKISFRTDESTFVKLKTICRIENRTISSLIESLLTEHVLSYDPPLSVTEEKRQVPRKKCSIPVVLSTVADGGRVYANGIIVSFSSEAMQILLSEPFDDIDSVNDVHALFTLPTQTLPLLVPCRITRGDYRHGEFVVIAALGCISDSETQSIAAFLDASDRSEKQ